MASSKTSPVIRIDGGSVDVDPEKSDYSPGMVPARYRGTATDKKDMMVLGREQVLRRNFKLITMMGFASTVVTTWEMLLPVFSYCLSDGGPALLFWAWIVVAIGMTLVYSSIAEMASMSPTAGGQYHWVSEFAPPKVQKQLSYVTGWLCTIGWQVYLCGVCFMVGSMIQGLIVLNVENYSPQSYQSTLLTIGVVVFAVAFNTSLATRLPLVEGIVLILHIAGFFAIIIPLWVMAPRAHADQVLLHFYNDGQWPTVGLSSMVGLTSVSVMIGYDCSVHMSEEINDASIVLPKSIMWATIPNFILGFIMVVTLIFTLGNIDNISETPTLEPFIQVFYNATKSYAATNCMVTVVIILLTSCCISEVATASRQLWSFARDGGLPCSAWLAHVSPNWSVPLRAILVSLVFSTLLSLINLGSTVALDAINSLGGVAILASYFITIGCLVWRRLCGAPLPPRRWSLGRYGLVINIAAMIFLLPFWFFNLWPLYSQVSASNFNWSSPIFAALLVIAGVYYLLQGRRQYAGPVTLMRREEMLKTI